jgi:phage-related protein
MKILPQLLLAGLTLIVKLAGALIDNLPKIIAAGGKILLALLDGIAKLIPKLLSLGWDLVKKLAGAIDDKVGDMFNVGANLIKGLWNGINSVKDWIIGKIGGFTDSIVKAVKGFFGVHSPSRVFRDEIGKMLGLGLADGMLAMKSDVLGAATRLSEWATPEPPDVSLAYATPTGIYGTLSSAVNGTVDVNSRDDRLAAAIDRLERKLTNLTVEMDGRTVGQIVEPHITKVQETKTIRNMRAKGL